MALCAALTIVFWTAAFSLRAEAAALGCGVSSDHCYATLRSNDTTFYGMYGTWNRAAMSAVGASASNGRMMTSEMWVVGPKGWVEVGLMQGYRGSAVGYYVYRGWGDLTGKYTELTLTKVTQNSGVTDEYQISRASTSNQWWIYWNGARNKTGNTGFWSTKRIEIGGEIASPSATAGQFTMYGKGITSSGGMANFTNQKGGATKGITASSPAVGTWKWKIS